MGKIRRFKALGVETEHLKKNWRVKNRAGPNSSSRPRADVMRGAQRLARSGVSCSGNVARSLWCHTAAYTVAAAKDLAAVLQARCPRGTYGGGTASARLPAQEAWPGAGLTCGARASVARGRGWRDRAGPPWRGGGARAHGSARPGGAAASGAARMVVGKRMAAVRMTRWPEKVFFPPTKLATQIYGARKMPWKNRDHPVEELDEIYKMIPLVAAEDEWMERNFSPEFHRSWRELEISRLDLGN